ALLSTVAIASEPEKEISKPTRSFSEHLAAANTHWAFQPLPPPVSRSLDSFVTRGLKTAGLSPAREADRFTLIRRVALMVTGLPPTPEEIELFVSDRKAKAYERMVERY